MTRLELCTACMLTLALSSSLARADEPAEKLTVKERQDLEVKKKELDSAGGRHYQNGKYPEAMKALEESLGIARRLYPSSEFPRGHADLAHALNNLAVLHQTLGKLADAESLYRAALDMNKRLFDGDHPSVAGSLNNLASLMQAQGKVVEAEPLFRSALDMRKRLFKDDHPAVSSSLRELSKVLEVQGKLAEAEPLSRAALEMNERLFKGDHPERAAAMVNLAGMFRAQGNLTDAEPLYRAALEMRKRLFRGDHPHIVSSLCNLAVVLQHQGKLVDAESLFLDALDMCKRIFKVDHPTTTICLSDLGGLYRAMGKPALAEPLCRESLEITRRLYRSDHPDLAVGLLNLSAVLRDQGKPADAEPIAREALNMYRRVFKGDHPHVAASHTNLGGVLLEREKPADAEPHFRDALSMTRRMFKGDHPEVARGLNNLAHAQLRLGKLTEAERLVREALEIRKRQHKEDHIVVGLTLNNLAYILFAQGKPADAEPLFREAWAMYRRLLEVYARRNSEGESHTLLASLPGGPREGFLSAARAQNRDAAAVYAEVWSSKGMIARIYEQRHLAARAVVDPKAAVMLRELTDSRRRRAEFLVGREVNDPATRARRDDDLKSLDARIATLDRELRPLLPTVERSEKLAKASPKDLQKALPADTAVVDFLRYASFEYNRDQPGKAREVWTERYLAFVVTNKKIAWIDLDTVSQIENAVAAWREAITGGTEIPAAIPATVRERVWDKVCTELPENVKVVYIAPDAALCRLPWAALPGKKPNSVLLEDHAVAMIPHAAFLLDHLWPNEPLRNAPTAALVVGGVRYDAELPPARPIGIHRGDPPVSPDARLVWPFLKGTATEAARVAELATNQRLPIVELREQTATGPAILAALPKARFAHIATHGFFADPSFRSVLQLDPKEFEQSRRGERMGRGANNPMVMTGLVFAGANQPKTPGRGIVTGEALIDLDLSGLELTVLSACETGLGDVAGGEGTFGLQRAFHLAGTRNVIASLWKVNDAATAALMAKFYHELWNNKRPPIEALREAQLIIYHRPDLIPDLAGERGAPRLKEVIAVKSIDHAREKNVKPAHTRLWAAFVVSGAGK